MDLPVIGAAVPRRGNAFSRWLGRSGLALLGWRVQGTLPDLPKMVIIGAPHTSNMDGVIALGTLLAMGMRATTMIKDSAFKGLLGAVLRWFGAIPINRRSPKDVVGQAVDAFNASAQLIMLIAPEGTRAGAPEWKRGFYRIAHQAGVPVVPAVCDYQRKLILFGPSFTPGGDYEGEFARLLRYYAGHGVARHPERLSKPLCEAMGREWRPSPDGD
jgi:1-acyl-sn-glycerol-3-phosphate acyltransferase